MAYNESGSPVQSSLSLAALGFKKRWRAIYGLNGGGASIGAQLPTSSYWSNTVSASSVQNPDWTTDWLSIPKAILLTNAAAGSAVIIASPSNEYNLGSRLGTGFYLNCRAGWRTATATPRMFIGMRSLNTAIGNVEPSTSVNCFGFGCDAADTQITFFHNDAAGSCTKDVINAGAGFPCTTSQADFYEFTIQADQKVPGTVSWSITNLISLVTASGSVTTDIPASNLAAALGPFFWMSCGTTASAASVAFQHIYIESDY